MSGGANPADVSVSSLISGFRRIPPAAVPAVLDCVIASTGLSPLSLFSSLLDSFPVLTKGIIKGNEKLDIEEKNFITSFVSASCHLLKISGANGCALQSFVWKILVPVMKSIHVHDCTVFNETADLFLNVVAETNTWGFIEESIVLFSLRSVGLSMGMLQSEEWSMYGWSRASVVGSEDQLTNSESNEDCMISPSENFPLHISCRVLAVILDFAVQSQKAAGSTLISTLASEKSAENFVKDLLWELCNMVLLMLVQSTEHRLCAVKFLLPNIFKAFVPLRAFEISVHGQAHILSRTFIFRKLWTCCKLLFSMGPLERRDSYRLLYLFLSFFSCADKSGDHYAFDGEEVFDIKAEKEFWEEMRKGLVDKEGFVRKQSLQILKMVLLANDGSYCYFDVSETKSSKETSMPHATTKRGRWANKEAESLGIGKICNSLDSSLNSQQKWEAFFLLYEMLEEYGTHLVEAAWNHKITLLLHTSLTHDDLVNTVNGELNQNEMEASTDIFKWLAVLWERGFMHENPLVRCLIMESFLGIDWKSYRHCAELVPEDFVLGPFIEGLNDPMHHKDFGIKGVYSSMTIEGATKFICQYASSLNVRKHFAFLTNLVSAIKRQSFGRAGLMAVTECITVVACRVQVRISNEGYSFCIITEEEKSFYNKKADLLDGLRFIIESSRQHFNPNYRFRVCNNVLEAAVSVMQAVDVPLETLLLFISAVPREFTDSGGGLRVKVQGWLSAFDDKCHTPNSCGMIEPLLKSLCEFPSSFVSHHVSVNEFISYDDEDLDAWESKAHRWARVLFLVIQGSHDVNAILTLVQTYADVLSKTKSHLLGVSVKFFILLVSLIQELQILQQKVVNSGEKGGSESERKLSEKVDHSASGDFPLIIQKFANSFSSILEGLVSFATSSCEIFWSVVVDDTDLPPSIRGKLGGPSQRRLPSSITTEVLQAITSVKVVASMTIWCAQFESDGTLSFAFVFFWNFFQKILALPTCDSETTLEVHLASYEALAHVLKVMVSQFPCLAVDLVGEVHRPSSLDVEAKSLIDSLVLSFLQHVNNLIAVEKLARSRRAVLLNLKWTCLEYLLSIPTHAFNNGVCMESSSNLISDGTLHLVFDDIVDSLENAGEESVLPMLRSVRFILEFFHTRISSVSSGDGVDAEMMWRLVSSSWILHVSCNKRRVAPIAALLSSVLHYSVFSKECMHESDGEPGPLKWFVEKVLEEGTRSPRTIRLAALHLTGLWLLNPKIIQYYVKELKLLTLYGSVAFDEDFEAELAENNDARREASLLAKSSDSELTVAFINTELYARVSVAVLFNKLADTAARVGTMDENENCRFALESGKMFLMELLDLAVNDKDLAKELYKKYSGVHRRKIRVWQMICILSRFVDKDILQMVTSNLHVSLYRNNLPAVRQYLETFGINIYLRFSSLVTEQLVPIFRNYDMRPQALSSYVFIAANVILHAPSTVQYSHLVELLPPIIPLLTSHHHSLRGFTQLLVFQVLIKLLPPLDSYAYEMSPLEKRCFEDLKSYLGKNSDCSRLRASMEGYLDAFNPIDSVTPAGIFSNRVEEVEFECVPTSLMEQVTTFLNDVREDLRFSMAKDAEIIRNESLRVSEDPSCPESLLIASKEEMQTQLAKELQLDFQRKITISKHDKDDADSDFCLWKGGSFKPLMEFEKEDQLLEEIFHSTSLAMEKIRGNRQPFILVGSLLDRIPNLAGLARTCEVFKAAGLAVADANVVHDKQFQLISVTAEKWIPVVEVPVSNLKVFLQKKKREGFSILGLEQTANSIPLDQFAFPKKTVLVLGREKEGIPVEIIHFLDACIEIPQLGIVRSLNVHVSGAIALWEYTRQQRSL